MGDGRRYLQCKTPLGMCLNINLGFLKKFWYFYLHKAKNVALSGVFHQSLRSPSLPGPSTRTPTLDSPEALNHRLLSSTILCLDLNDLLAMPLRKIYRYISLLNGIEWTNQLDVVFCKAEFMGEKMLYKSPYYNLITLLSSNKAWSYSFY